jgi:hypothetical protein
MFFDDSIEEDHVGCEKYEILDLGTMSGKYM